MIRFLSLFCLVILANTSNAQDKVTLNGYVKDAETGEELIGVTVYFQEIQAGVVTNPYGFYSITVRPGTYKVQFSYIGYRVQVVTLDISISESRNIELQSEATYINEVVVESTPLDDNVVNVQMSHNSLDISQIKKLPPFMGEVDIIKNIQMLPGVITAGEGTSAFYVRGGGADQNLILIDEAPVYDPSHLFGLFSVFNSDVIKDAELYKGGIPARFGGRLSSILEVRTKDGNNKEFHATGGIGTLASRLMFEGPIKKDKASFVVSARRSYADLFLKAANQDNIVKFYDINAKVNWKGNNKNRFFAAFYSGRDKFNLNDDFGFSWGNSTATLRWNHLFNDRLFSNTSLIASNFDYALEIIDPVDGLKWTSNLQEYSFKNDFSYFLSPKNELTFGYHLTGRRFSPGRITPYSNESIFKEVVLPKQYALDHGLYANNKHVLTDKLTIDYGLRLSIFQSIGESDVYTYVDPQDNIDIVRTDTLHFSAWQNIKTFVNLEPRVGIKYSLAADQSLKLSYNRMVQNTHLISSGTVPVPFNTWSPSGYYLKPQLADQIAAGYFRNFKENMYEFSVETYYKEMQNVTDFADNAQLFFNEDLSTEYRQGTSTSYGAEFMINKKQGRLTGMIAYTLSKTTRDVPGVNLDRTFFANYDRRHVFNMYAVYELNPKWTFGANFNYSTGRPITLSAGKYEYGQYNPDLITERNGYRLPSYNRFDLSATLTPKKKNPDRKWEGQWVFSIYNVYSRKNPFTVYTRTRQDKDGNIIGDGTEKEARLVYLFPFLPSVTYNFKF